MFTRELMQRVEGYFSQSGANMTRMEGMAKGVLLVLQVLIAALAMPTQLWNAGVGAAVEAADDAGKPAGSQYTRRWWLALQMALAVFTVAMKTPVGVLMNLAVTDGTLIMLGEDGELIRPFAVFDPAAVAPEFVGMTLERLVYSDPEMVAPVVVVEPIDEPIVA